MASSEREVETMVLSDDGVTSRTVLDGRPLSKRSTRQKFNLFHMGFGCLGIAFLAIVVAVTLYATMPNMRRSTSTSGKPQGNQEIILKGMFSTSYIPSNENQRMNIKNLDEITNQLNMKLNAYKLRVMNAFFRTDLLSKTYRQMICENPLSGNIFQLNIVAFYSDKCPAQNKDICKTQFHEQLKNMFSRMSTISIRIQFGDNTFKNINIQICSLTEQMEQEEDKPVVMGRKVETTTIPIPVTEELSENDPADVAAPSVVLKKTACTLQLGRVNFVHLTDSYGGSLIQDDTRTNGISNDDPYRQYLTATLYEDTTYRLHIQLDCSRQTYRNSRVNGCHRSQNVNVWIDFNGNGVDDGESRVLRRARSQRNISSNTWDLDLYIPAINSRNIRTGAHRMRVTVVPNEEYQRDCGAIQDQEGRDYTINIVPKATYSVPVVETAPANIIYRDPVVNPAPANIAYRDPVCSQNIAKITLVIMAGERGTEIRDDLAASTSLNDYRNNQHHLAVTLYEQTVYLLRIQLDCTWQLDNELFEHGCNLAQDVHAWVDINDDGRFDQSELGTPHRWPVTSYMAKGIYDIQIHIPSYDVNYLRNRQHRMRIVVLPSQYYQRVCGRSDYNETRDYTVTIIPRSGYIAPTDVTTPYTVLSNIVCTADVGKIVLVVMAGEHRTQIRDDPTTRAILNTNLQNQQHQAIVLYEDTVYLLRIQLSCNQQWLRDSYQHNCHLIYDVNVWIDLNDDGIYDSSENAVPFRWPITSYTPQGVYDLQIYVPVIDTQRIRTGPHRMQLVVTMTEQYRRQCGNNDHKETRDYTVSIVPYGKPPVDNKLPYLTLSDNVCSLNNGKMSLVIMAGEQGTHIRDNIPPDTILRDTQNRHHLAVTLHDSSVYRLRVQLDCDQRSGGVLPNINCNFAQDVNVLIDFNNDDRFDDTESRVPQRWPLRSSMPLGIYDFEIDIPPIDGLNTKGGSHRMRIVVVPSEEYRRKCGATDYRETREYTINLIPKVVYRGAEYRYQPVPRVYPAPVVTRGTYCSPGNLICSEGIYHITSLNLLGERNTQIDDNLVTCSGTDNYHDRSNLAVTLFENNVYTLRIQLACALAYSQDPYTFERNCNSPQNLDIWIDLNNDGLFDENERQIVPNNGYIDNQYGNQFETRISIPRVDGRSYLNEQHRMRVILTQSNSNRQACYNTGYGEARDYTVQIITNSGY